MYIEQCLLPPMNSIHLFTCWYLSISLFWRHSLLKLNLILRIDWYHLYFYFCYYIFPFAYVSIWSYFMWYHFRFLYDSGLFRSWPLGEKARLQLPTMKENDTHCIDFSYLLYSQKGLNPGTWNILVRWIKDLLPIQFGMWLDSRVETGFGLS